MPRVLVALECPLFSICYSLHADFGHVIYCETLSCDCHVPAPIWARSNRQMLPRTSRSPVLSGSKAQSAPGLQRRPASAVTPGPARQQALRHCRMSCRAKNRKDHLASHRHTPPSPTRRQVGLPVSSRCIRDFDVNAFSDSDVAANARGPIAPDKP